MERQERVFIGTTDAQIVNRIDQIALEIGAVETFVGVIGGFACFTLIEKIRPQKVILYDRNSTQLAVFNFFRSLIAISSDPENFVARLLSRPNFLNNQPSDDLLFKDTLRKLQDFSGYAPGWLKNLLAFAQAQNLDKGVYFTPETNGSRPLFILNPAKYDLEKDHLKKRLSLQPLALYLGQGWLKDQASFEYIKKRLIDETMETMELKIPKIRPLKKSWSENSNLLWVSNIRFFKHWPEYPAEERLKFLKRLPDKIKILTSQTVLDPADLLDWRD